MFTRKLYNKILAWCLNTNKKLVSWTNPTEECDTLIREVINEDIYSLHNTIRNFIFQEERQEIISLMPQWVGSAGISPESKCSKELFEEFREQSHHPIFGKCVYYYDLLTKITALQDRLNAVVMFMRQLYGIVPCKVQFNEEQYTSAALCSGGIEGEAHILLNMVFVAYASVFDILSKIAVEQYSYEQYNFENYKKMVSAKTIYKKKLKVDSSLKKEGLLFSEPRVIRIIESFRNEYVHNGPWDLVCSVYETSVDGVPADVVIYCPDMDENGNFINSGSRNKFYSQSNRINNLLPNMIKDATVVVKSTIEQLNKLYQNGITKNVSQDYTNECLKAIAEFPKSMLKKWRPHCCSRHTYYDNGTCPHCFISPLCQ